MSEPIKVGDELAFDVGRYGEVRYVIKRVDAITPSGRIKCGEWTLNPDLTIRGHGKWSVCSCAERVTQEIRDNILRRNLLAKISAVSEKRNDISLDNLKKIAAIIDGKDE